VRTSRRLPLETLAPYLVDVPHPGFLPPDSALLAPTPPIDWRLFFGNDQPVEIERKYVFVTATRLAQAAVANVKLACTAARWFLRERVAAGSVSALHVYFPDPWWKNRHRKRKLFTRDFAEECVRVLKESGRLHFVTDVADYFAESIEMLKDVPALRPLPVTQPDEEYLTNFERKYRLEGRAIYRALYEKNPSEG
jgi:tRNA (guanine-N7-)-methyltransferase